MSTAPHQSAPMYQHLGRYELLGEIASGGMATVYLGRHLGAKGFARLVAIKRLHPHLQREQDFVAMFLDEARLAARIRHPNVVSTLDVDDHAGLYIVMEYIEGDQLLGLLRHTAQRGEQIPRGIALTIAIEALSGLHAAHELVDDNGEPLHLVHRDVSPQNVLVGVDGATRITDFGIAKAESRLTQTRDGQLKGKIAYMAPEQTRRSIVDRRSDVFAMGILTWEMLTGRRLFKGDSDVQILNAVVNEPIPPPRVILPSLPPVLNDVVMRALERNLDVRYATAEAFADALENVASLMGGRASNRAVAQYVQTVAGPKIQQERARLKAGLTLSRRVDADGASAEAQSAIRAVLSDDSVVSGTSPGLTGGTSPGLTTGTSPGISIITAGIPAFTNRWHRVAFFAGLALFSLAMGTVAFLAAARFKQSGAAVRPAVEAPRPAPAVAAEPSAPSIASRSNALVEVPAPSAGSPAAVTPSAEAAPPAAPVVSAATPEADGTLASPAPRAAVRRARSARRRGSSDGPSENPYNPYR